MEEQEVQKMVNIKLVIFKITYPHYERFVVSTNDKEFKCPTHAWNHDLEKIVKVYTDLSYNWIKPDLSQVIEELDGSLSVVYYMILPHGQEIKTGHWISLNNLGNSKNLELVINIGNNI